LRGNWSMPPMLRNSHQYLGGDGYLFA
jgi:hypothetical protein